MPDFILYEDARHVMELLVMTGRAVPASRWADEAIAAADADDMEGFF
jgi:hypothetical protein